MNRTAFNAAAFDGAASGQPPAIPAIYPDLARGPARAAGRAAATAYGVLAPTPPDLGVVLPPVIAAAFPHRAPAPARTANVAYAGLLATGGGPHVILIQPAPFQATWAVTDPASPPRTDPTRAHWSIKANPPR